MTSIPVTTAEQLSKLVTHLCICLSAADWLVLCICSCFCFLYIFYPDVLLGVGGGIMGASACVFSDTCMCTCVSVSVYVCKLCVFGYLRGEGVGGFIS